MHHQTLVEMSHYDFAIEYEERFVRVQVKSTMYKRQGTYVCNVLANNGPYGANHIDFVAAYVIPKDVGYIIGYPHFKANGHVHLSPH